MFWQRFERNFGGGCGEFEGVFRGILAGIRSGFEKFFCWFLGKVWRSFSMNFGGVVGGGFEENFPKILLRFQQENITPINPISPT